MAPVEKGSSVWVLRVQVWDFWMQVSQSLNISANSMVASALGAVGSCSAQCSLQARGRCPSPSRHRLLQLAGSLLWLPSGHKQRLPGCTE